MTLADIPPRVLPPAWKAVDVRRDGCAYRNRTEGLSVIVSLGTEDDGRSWVHLSVSHKHRLPTWDEFVRVKELFLGRERLAIQVLAPRSEWVNIHPHVLHLWSCLDETRLLPDFTRGMGSI